MSLRTSVKKDSIPNFELRSVMLFSALVMGLAITAQAQSSPQPLAPRTVSAQLVASGTVDAIPPNQTTSREVDAAFNRANTSADGNLSREEARHFPAIELGVDQIDSKHDTFISQEEFMKTAGSGF